MVVPGRRLDLITLAYDGYQRRAPVGFNLDKKSPHPGQSFDVVEGSIQQEGQISQPPQVELGSRLSGCPDRREHRGCNHVAPLRVGWNFQS